MNELEKKRIKKLAGLNFRIANAEKTLIELNEGIIESEKKSESIKLEVYLLENKYEKKVKNVDKHIKESLKYVEQIKINLDKLNKLYGR